MECRVWRMDVKKKQQLLIILALLVDFNVLNLIIEPFFYPCRQVNECWTSGN